MAAGTVGTRVGRGAGALIAAALALLTLVAFREAPRAAFVNYDDPQYVTDNEQVRAGLSLAGVRWAFTTTHASNWHPLTWLSHMLDCSLFGLDPGKHHLVSLALHVANALLVFALWQGLTGARWRSALLAALFALHPLRVESVLWVAERKDVLSTLLGLLAALSYLAYARGRSRVWYAAALACFALGLLAKPMLVTLPLLLLLLDYWPLGRRVPALREKLPFLALALLSGVATLVAQRAAGAVKSLVMYPWPLRLENTLTAYAAYLGKIFLPLGLSVFYPHPAGAIPLVKVLGAAAFLAALSAAAWRLRRTRPYVLAGWCWYLLALLPVIGLVQVGNQALADRYTYMPALGIVFAVVWGVGEALGARARWRPALAVAAAACVLLLGLAAARRAGDWRDSLRLFGSAVALDPDNWLAHENLGYALVTEAGKPQEALGHYQRSARLYPGRPRTYNFMGVALGKLGRRQESLLAYREAVRLQPDYGEAWFNLGLASLSSGDVATATDAYRQLLRVNRPWAARLEPFVASVSRR